MILSCDDGTTPYTCKVTYYDKRKDDGTYIIKERNMKRKKKNKWVVRQKRIKRKMIYKILKKVILRVSLFKRKV